MKIKSNKIIVIAGPTASGKTTLAVNLAGRFNGEIVSADSRQVYKNMDIGTGKDLSEYQINSNTITCHLIDITDPKEIFTLFHYQQLCYKTLSEILNRDRLPILTGGTGLYIEAVLKKYKIPNIPENILLRKNLMEKDKESLEKELKKTDHNLYLTTDKNSKKRIVRALEIAKFEKDNSVEWGVENPPSFEPLIICTKWNREVLISRIDRRLKERFNDGMIREVQNLLDTGVSLDRLAMFGMEYKHIAKFIINNTNYSQMVSELATDIHRLAKRQMTYFRGMERRGLNIEWVENANYNTAQKLISNFIS